MNTFCKVSVILKRRETKKIEVGKEVMCNRGVGVGGVVLSSGSEIRLDRDRHSADVWTWQFNSPH